jgi:hypothetical protein
MADIDKSDFDLIGDDDKPAEPTWLGYPIVVMHLNDGTFHADVINHYQGRLNEADDLTDSHETTHMVNADLRNAHGDHVSGRYNAFYVGNSKAIVLPEPKFSKSLVAPLVPNSLQGYRYPTYVTGMTEWNDSPFYLHDEQIAYTNGGATGVEEVEKGTYRGDWTDGVSGCLEFAVYTSALFLAVEQNDPTYLTENPEYLEYLNWVLQRSHEVYAKGSVMSQFKWDTQNKFLSILQSDSGASEIRRVLKDYCSNAFLT